MDTNESTAGRAGCGFLRSSSGLWLVPTLRMCANGVNQLGGEQNSAQKGTEERNYFNTRRIDIWNALGERGVLDRSRHVWTQVGY